MRLRAQSRRTADPNRLLRVGTSRRQARDGRRSRAQHNRNDLPGVAGELSVRFWFIRIRWRNRPITRFVGSPERL